METLHTIGILYLFVGIVSFLFLLFDIVVKKQRQAMSIMNIVWPITGLYLGIIAIILYKKWGKAKHETSHMDHMHIDMSMPNSMKMSVNNVNFKTTALSTMHCGSGCTLGDAISEPLMLVFPITIVSNAMYNKWLIQFAFAFVIGILFQYFAIKQMQPKLPFSKIILKALKADTLSLIFWQIGMYGGMAIAKTILPIHSMQPTTTIYWFCMQIAMILGFCTAFPINYWLLKKGVKEPM
ncbi:MAG: hypothetical protein DI598_13090 [Pseudopedobacter saltans]|uniref:DUF4396 domain-containing protein n=1 Tax=Pseudopedobacter saltans TaxID=151895 RepID=A0A2W5GIK4_9SPHI|nr:MAG: hypothetical protein DI598_13090 [Pseudopedobacter saltans]